MKSTFPLVVYGCMDTASRKLLFVRIGAGNLDPKGIGWWYFEYLYQSKMIASMIRLDKGTETGLLATSHVFLRDQNGDMDALDTVIYGKSTSNQVKFVINLAEFEQIQLIYHLLCLVVVQENIL